MRASKAWRRAFWEEMYLPDSVAGSWERAPLAREDSILQMDDIMIYPTPG
jgi:hypothetical protein